MPDGWKKHSKSVSRRQRQTKKRTHKPDRAPHRRKLGNHGKNKINSHPPLCQFCNPRLSIRIGNSARISKLVLQEKMIPNHECK